MDKLEVQLGALITHKARQDIGVLDSIEGSSVGRIVRNVISGGLKLKIIA